jgi:hypothetical protein
LLYDTLNFLADQLNSYFDSFDEDDKLIPSSPIVKLENIGLLDETKLKAYDNILITLVNISEETTLKNVPTYIKEADKTVYKNPPVFINLYVLITACMQKYDHGLIYLSHVINFFQGQSIFTTRNSIIKKNKETAIEDFKVIVELYSLTTEQVNYVWSTLGGKQHPFVCYKVRLLQMEKASTKETRGIITDIHINEK